MRHHKACSREDNSEAQPNVDIPLPISESIQASNLGTFNRPDWNLGDNEAVKRIEAVIRINKLESVKEALEDAGVIGITCEQVKGYGRQQGRTDKYRGSTYALNLLPKMKIEVIVTDADLETAIAAIVETARSGDIGDGKIFVSDVSEVIRIRTGETGDAALR